MTNIYCGKNNILPDNYNRFGTNFECLHRGFQTCKYNGKLGSKFNESIPLDPNRPKIFCGYRNLPEGYLRNGQRNECLRKGYGTCLYKDPSQIVNQNTPNIITNTPNNKKPFYKNFWFWIAIIFLLIIIILIILYFSL